MSQPPAVAPRAAGKVVLVTGGGGPIGRATALAFSRGAARVVVSDSDADAGEETVALITAEGGSAIFAWHDVSREDDWRAIIDSTLSRYHRLDVLAHTPHEDLQRPLFDFTIESFRAYQRRNLLAPWLGLKYAGPAVRIYGRGAIVLVGSTRAVSMPPGSAGPAMATSALRLMARAAAAEFAERDPKVRVNTVLADPAYFALGHAPPDAPRQGRSPHDVAHTIFYLASDAARFLTGTEIVVNNPADAGVAA